MRYLPAAVVLLMGAGAPAAGQTSPADSLLDRLVGHWHMSGTVQGEKAESHLAAERVLQGRFVLLHMTDLGQPSQYEAMVFLGVDSTNGGVVAHWLDNFGPGPSVTLGFGTVAADSLVLNFGYPEGPFRDTFTYDAQADRWRVLLESGDGKGGWGTFADYQVRRAGR